MGVSEEDLWERCENAIRRDGLDLIHIQNWKTAAWSTTLEKEEKEKKKCVLYCLQCHDVGVSRKPPDAMCIVLHRISEQYILIWLCLVGLV